MRRRRAVRGRVPYCGPRRCPQAGETLLLHRAVLRTLGVAVVRALVAAGVSLRLDPESLATIRAELPAEVAGGKLTAASEGDFRTEFGALTMAVRASGREYASREGVRLGLVRAGGGCAGGVEGGRGVWRGWGTSRPLSLRADDDRKANRYDERPPGTFSLRAAAGS